MAGFQHNKTYIIQSAFDGSVMDLRGSSTANGTPIVSWRNNDGKKQKWIANQESNGFRLVSPTSKPDTLKAMDHRSDGTVILWDFHAGLNQQWTTRHVSEDKYLIICAKNNMAIRHLGYDQIFKCSKADPKDISQLWTIRSV